MGGNLIIATVLSLVLAGIGFPLVWGILGGSMPRSGGEYIYNSRILHPLVGIGESFGNAFIWLMWIYVLAPWMADPGCVMLSDMHGLELALQLGDRAVLRRALLRVGLVRHRHDRQHHRLPVRRVRGQGVRPGAEGGHGPWARSAPSSSSSCCSATASRTSSTPGTPWRRRTARYNYTDFIAATSAAAAYRNPHDLELVRHLRCHGRGLVAVRLLVLHHVHRRRGEAARQEHHPVEPLRHHPPGGSHDPRRQSACTGWSTSTSSPPLPGSTRTAWMATTCPGARTSWAWPPS